MINIVHAVTVIVVPVIMHGLFQEWLLTVATFMILALSSPWHTLAQGTLALAWVALTGGTADAAGPLMAWGQTAFHAAQGVIWIVAFACGKHVGFPRMDPPEFVLRHARPLRFLLCTTGVLLVLACFFRSMSWFHAGWAVAVFAATAAVPRPQVTPGTRTATVLTVILGLSSTLFSISLLELAVRYALPEPPRPNKIYMEDRDYIFKLRPGAALMSSLTGNDNRPYYFFVEISSQGIRDREFGPKAADEFRIVALGDSYTMGRGLVSNDTYSRVLERALNDGGFAKRITVVNCGVGGYAPWQERGFLNRCGFAFEPDLVVLQLFPSNDVSGSYTRVGKLLRAFDTKWENVLRMYRRKSEFPVQCERWLQQYSNLYAVIVSLTGSDGIIVYPIADLRFLEPMQYVPQKPKSNRTPNQEVCLVEWYPELQEAWDLYADDIKGIRDDCHARGVGLVAFAHGDAISLASHGWDELNTAFAATPYEANKDIRLTNELFEKLTIPYVDVLGPLRDYRGPMEAYYKYDGHWTPAGAQIVAASVAEYLGRNYLPQRIGAGAPAADLQVH